MKQGIGRTLVLAVAVVIAGLAVACGGGGDNKNGGQAAAGETQPAAESQATPSGATPAATTARSAPTAAPTGTSGDNGSTSPNLTALESLQSYRYKVTFAIQGATGADQSGINFNQEGAWVSPNKSTAKCDGSFGPLTLQEETITIGDTTWVKSDSTNGQFQQATDATSTTCTFTPEELLSSFSSSDFSGIKGARESVNGVNAVRYDLDEKTAKELLDLARAFGASEDPNALPPDMKFTFSVWLAEDGGWPVRELLDMSGSQSGQQFTFHVESNITNVNDSSISINPP